MAYLKNKANPLPKLAHRLLATSDEGLAGNLYLEEARKGHHVLAVYEPESGQTETMSDLLKRYHAHLIK